MSAPSEVDTSVIDQLIDDLVIDDVVVNDLDVNELVVDGLVINANRALARAIQLAEAAAQAMAAVPMESLHGAGLGDLLVRLRGVQRRLDAAGSALSTRFAASSEWDLLGARNAVSWLHGQANDPWSSSRSLFDRGAAVQEFPHVARAWRSGEIGAQHVDALAKLVRRFPRLNGDLVAVDEAIATVASACEPREFYQRLRQLCHQIDPGALEDGREGRGTGLYVSMLLDGFVRVDGMLDPVLGAHFMAALECGQRDLIESTKTQGDPDSMVVEPVLDESANQSLDSLAHLDMRPRSERNLDALRRILQAAGAATGDLALPLISGERGTVNVLVPVEALTDPRSAEVGWLERFGVPTTMITGSHARQLACDASVRPLVMDSQGQLVAMLPKARTIHPALRRAVFMRDGHCRFPGCRSRIDEVHHIHFHSHGGPTVLANLLGLCWGHHHRIHESGWRLEGEPGGEITFRSRHGRELLGRAPEPWVTAWSGSRRRRTVREASDVDLVVSTMADAG